jgi:polar amino acid transport system substrate-binding protein
MAERPGHFGVNMLRRLKLAGFLNLIFLCFACPPAVADEEANLPAFRFFYELHSPMLSEDESGRVQGYEAARFTRLMVSLPFTVKLAGESWARAWAAVRTEKNSCFLPLARTPDRETEFFWVGPFGKARYGLYALKSRQLKLSSLEDAAKLNLIVGVLANQASDSITKAVPGLHREAVTATSLNFRKLLAGRVDIVIKRDGAAAEEVPEDAHDIIEKILDLPPLDVGIGCNPGSDPTALQILKSQAERLYPPS